MPCTLAKAAPARRRGTRVIVFRVTSPAAWGAGASGLSVAVPAPANLVVVGPGGRGRQGQGGQEDRGQEPLGERAWTKKSQSLRRSRHRSQLWDFRPKKFIMVKQTYIGVSKCLSKITMETL